MVVYIGWNKDWADMKGRIDRGPVERTTEGARQRIEFISKAPRVFPDRESLQQFLVELSTITRSEKIRWGGAAPGYTATSATPADLADIILASPEPTRGRMTLSTPAEDVVSTTGADAGNDVVLPGFCSISLTAPVNWDNGNDLAVGMGSSHSVGISVINTISDNMTEIQPERIIGALRMYTVSPSKADRRKLRGFIPIAVEESRQTVAQRKWEARIQRKAILAGAATAFVVTGGVEILKAVFAAGGSQ